MAGPKPRTALQRAWPKIRLGGPDDCWVWTGSTNNMPRPYGHLLAEGTTPGDRRTMYVHRMVYEAFIGPIPDGLQIDHLCNNSLCCNPAHLEAVTQEVNLARRRPHHNSRKTHCKRGHPFDTMNTIITKDDRRQCRTCMRSHQRTAAANARARAKIGG